MKRSAVAVLIALTLGLGAMFITTSLLGSHALASGNYSSGNGNGN